MRAVTLFGGGGVEVELGAATSSTADDDGPALGTRRSAAVGGVPGGRRQSLPLAGAARPRLPARPPGIVVTMSTAMPFPTPDDTAETYWDGFYRGLNRPADSAPGPNALFVDEVGPLSPGTALDLGCGFVRGST